MLILLLPPLLEMRLALAHSVRRPQDDGNTQPRMGNVNGMTLAPFENQGELPAFNVSLPHAEDSLRTGSRKAGHYDAF